MGQIYFPDNIPDLAIATTTTITMATTYRGQDTRITIGGQQYKYSSTITINFATTGINGLDTGAIAANTLYYIYAVQSSGTPGLVASTSSSAPTGFTAYKEVARCRTFLGSATLAAIGNRDGLLPRKPNTEMESATVVLNGSTNAVTFTNQTTTARQRRVGDVMELEVNTAFTGAPGAGTGHFRWLYPNSYSVDTTKVVRSRPQANTWIFNITYNAANGLLSSTSIDHSSSVGVTGFSVAFEKVGPITSDRLNLAWPAAWANGDFINITTTVPIAEWAGIYT